MSLSKILFIFLLSFSATSFSQKQYQGLLWEISGNGLEKSSYLYGTMHVSNKLAFNVSDSFYICLDKVEAVALESSPADWMQDYRDMGAFSTGMNYNYDADFYHKAFNIKSPETQVIFDLLENKNSLMNQILYRFRPGNEDYQENTFLDMFIYQAGAKNGKQIHPLETLDEVTKLSIKSMTPDKKKKRNNSNNNYLKKESKQKYLLLEEAYRRGDLDQIDSLSKSDNPTEVYHKYFIVERNRNMVIRMDSIMKKQSIFTGIGAAHLPGEEGAIELLRDLGYTVRAVDSKSSGKSHKMRKKFEEIYRSVEFRESTTSDQYIQTETPGLLYEMPTYKRGKLEYLCPEPINGGYYSVIRLFTYGPITQKDPDYYQKTFDSLLYIATPGEMMKKEDIEVNGHKGYKILTKTSKNAYVNYTVVFTPMEIIVFKGSGIDNYIQRAEPQLFFDKIRIQPNSSNWAGVTPKFGGAQWKMKGSVSCQDMVEGLNEQWIDPLYQSYDASTGAYYQVMRYSYNDLDFIEEDSFDLAYLGKIYGENLGYDIASTNYTSSEKYATVFQTLVPDENHKQQAKKLELKLITRGGMYFLMSTTAGKNDTQTFFDSFKFTDYEIEEDYEIFEDTLLHYSVNTIKKEDKPNYSDMYSGYGGYYDEDEDKSYLGNNDSRMHYSYKTQQSIYVGYSKFHDYDGATTEKNFWDYRIKRLTDENKLRISRKKFFEKNGDKCLSFYLTDTNSTKAIMTQLRLHHGVLYTLQTLIDSTDGPSNYAKTFFESFQPLDTLIGRDIFEDKADVFFDHIMGDDSLQKVNALKSIKKVDFKEKDVPGIVNVYQNFEFDEETENEDREDLIMTLGNVEDQGAYDFLNEVYDTNNFNSDLQFIVLKCFSYTETKEAYRSIENQLLNNTPFTENEKKLNFFNNLYDSLELAKAYFPKMLELSQYPEYKPYVVELLTRGYLDKVFTFSDFSSEKSAIYRNAKIELKRTVANQNNERKKKNKYYYGTDSKTSAYHNIFVDYYALMCAFKKNGHQDTEEFFKDIYRIKNKKFLIEAEIIHEQLGMAVDTSIINDVTKDIDYRVWAYNRLKKNEMLHYFNPSITQKDMAYALLYDHGFNEEEDTVSFVRRELVKNGKNEGYIYFFKRKTERNKNWMIDYVGLMPIAEDDLESSKTEIKKGLSVKNDDEIEKTIEKTREIFEMKFRKRVVLSTYNYEGWGGLF